jgi:hypothetical protein
MIGRAKFDDRIVVNSGSGLHRRFSGDEHVSGKNQRPRAFARRRQAAVDDELIEAGLRHRLGPAEAGHYLQPG